MNRITRTLLMAAVAMTLPLASFAAGATDASATSTPAAKAPASGMKKTAVHHASMTGTAARTAPASTTTKAPGKKSMTARWVDLNEGTRDQLMQLAGVTDTIAEAIIAGRPYTAKAQLLDKKIVDPKTYKKINRFLSLKAPATQPAGQ